MPPAAAERFRNARVLLYSRSKLKNVTPGEAESIFAGDGIEYATTRPYEPGDDLRDLDLPVLAQSGDEEIVERVVDRQRRVYLWVDVSGSMQRFPQMFFSGKPEIRDIATGLLAFSAQNAYSPVGLGAFGGRMIKVFPAQSGENHAREIVDWLLTQAEQNDHGPADMAASLTSLYERVPAQSLVLFISDFHGLDSVPDLSKRLRNIARKFDLVPVVVREPLEIRSGLELPITVSLEDPATRRRAEIRLTVQRLADLQARSAQHLAGLRREFSQAGAEPIVLDSPLLEDCYRALCRFFEARRRARR